MADMPPEMEQSENPMADAIGAVQQALQGISEGSSDQSPEAAKLFQQALDLVNQASEMLAGGGQGAAPPQEQQAAGNANAVPMR